MNEAYDNLDSLSDAINAKVAPLRAGAVEIATAMAKKPQFPRDDMLNAPLLALDARHDTVRDVLIDFQTNTKPITSQVARAVFSRLLLPEGNIFAVLDRSPFSTILLKDTYLYEPAQKLLAQSHILTVGELAQYSPKMLQNLPGIGDKMCITIERWLTKNGLQLSMISEELHALAKRPNDDVKPLLKGARSGEPEPPLEIGRYIDSFLIRCRSAEEALLLHKVVGSLAQTKHIADPVAELLRREKLDPDAIGKRTAADYYYPVRVHDGVLKAIADDPGCFARALNVVKAREKSVQRSD